MKKVLFLLVISILILTICGCSFLDSSLSNGRDKNKEKSISFKVEKIALSKGFQSTEPKVEIVKRDNIQKLLASLGVVETSGVEVDKVTKTGENISIYIDNSSEKQDLQLAIPQVLLEISNLDIENLKDLKFEIINKNYEPITLKFNKSEILKNVYSQFEITPTNIPVVELNKLKDNMFWDISFQNLFNKEDSRPSLINFNVKVDANTGEILNSEKENISTFIDEGTILDYIPNTHLLYKKESLDSDNEYESLWIYNIESGKKEKLYTSKNKISSISISPDNENISLIEVDDNKSDIYIISQSDKIPYKITPTKYLQPKLMKWKDNETLNFMDLSEKSSTLLRYNINENETKVEFNSKKLIDSFDVLENKYLFLESNEDSINKTIYLAQDSFEFKEIGIGLQASFFDKNTILYLNNIEDEDKNILHTYHIQNEYEFKNPKFNITNYFKIDDENIAFVVKNTCNNNYTLKKHNMLEKDIEPIASITNKNIYYNPISEIGYVNLDIPDDEDDQRMIYSINLNKLDVIEN